MDDTEVQQSDSEFTGIKSLDALFNWLKGHDRTVLLAGVGFQVVVLLTMIVIPFTTLLTGDSILLRVVPLDPRDLFRGDYVILSYEFSRFPPQGIPGLRSTDHQGRFVFVAMLPEEDGKHWHPGQFSLQKPSTGKFLRGQITGRNRIEFGIESFFVQEGEGLKYEIAARNQTLSAEVSLDRNGKAVLKGLVVN